MEIQELLDKRFLHDADKVYAGVYFLTKEGQVVYIGKSEGDVKGRVLFHRKESLKDFDKALAVECESGQALGIESFFLNKHECLSGELPIENDKRFHINDMYDVIDLKYLTVLCQEIDGRIIGRNRFVLEGFINSIRDVCFKGFFQSIRSGRLSYKELKVVLDSKSEGQMTERVMFLNEIYNKDLPKCCLDGICISGKYRFNNVQNLFYKQ